jgi:mercuric ion binding protein
MKLKTNTLVFLSLMLCSTVWGAQTNVDVTVNGMVCSFCAQGITKKFKAKKEVDAVKVVLQDQKVYLTLKDGADLSDSDITQTLKKAGYSVAKIERKKP